MPRKRKNGGGQGDPTTPLSSAKKRKPNNSQPQATKADTKPAQQAAGDGSVDNSKKRKYKRLRKVWGSVEPTFVADVGARSINVEEFAEARANELHHLMQQHPKVQWQGKNVHQNLPRHLRRRAMSHNVHMIPRRLRKRAAEENARNPTKPPQNRRRKRRPKFLMESYARRQRQHVWLETHLWSAKRMHMDSMWGCRLALRPTQKGDRFLYKAARHLCTLYDASYITCVELSSASRDALRTLLWPMLPPPETTGAPSVFSAYFADGSRAGTTLLHLPGQYPRGVVAPVQFMWQPTSNKDAEAMPDNSNRSSSSSSSVAHASAIKTDAADTSSKTPGGKTRLWIWTHAAVLTEVLGLFRSCIEESSLPIELASLASELLRFELRGARATSVLNEVISPLSSSKAENQSAPSTSAASQGTASTKGSEIEASSTVDKDGDVAMGDIDGSDAVGEKKDADCGPSEVIPNSSEAWELLRHMRSADSAPAGVVVGLRTADPRQHDPVQPFRIDPDTKKSQLKEKHQQELDQFTNDPEAQRKLQSLLTEWPATLCDSKLWSAEQRSKMTSSIANNDLKNHPRKPRRKTKMVAGGVSVLLVQRSPKNSASPSPCDFESGWDIIMPAEWGMPFWKALVFAGARVSGLENRREQAFERGVPSFPEDFPDSISGHMFDRWNAHNARLKYERKPKTKRMNFDKMFVSHPFEAHWPDVLGFQKSEAELLTIEKSLSPTSPQPLSLSSTTSIEPATSVDSTVVATQASPGTERSGVLSESSSAVVGKGGAPSTSSKSSEAEARITEAATPASQTSPDGSHAGSMSDIPAEGGSNSSNSDIASSSRPETTSSSSGAASANEAALSVASKDESAAAAQKAADASASDGHQKDSSEAKADECSSGKAVVDPTSANASPARSALVPYYVLRDRVLVQKLFKANAEPTKTPYSISESLVAVSLQLMQRGLPTDLALICAPTDDDYKKFVLKEVEDPIMKPDPVLSVKEPKKKFAAQKVTRETIGRVVRGGFSLSRGCGHGTGFCSTLKLREVFQDQCKKQDERASTSSKKRSTAPKVLVLVRGVSSQTYFPAFVALQSGAS